MACPAIIKKAGLSFAGLALGLLLVEMALRLFFPADPAAMQPRYFIHEETKSAWSPPQELLQPVYVKDVFPDHPQREDLIYYQHAPSFAYAHEYPSNPRGYFDANNRVSYKTNKNGFRGPDLPAVPSDSPGRARQVVVLGDSFTYGEGVRLPDTFTALLAKAVGGAGPGQDVDVLNFGQPGLDTAAEFFVWLKHKSLVRPDIVLLAVTPNDVVCTPEQAAEKRRIDESYLRLFQPPAGLARYSRLVHLVQARLTRRKLSRELTDIMVHDLHRRSDNAPSPWEMCSLQLRQMGGDIVSGGAAFMVVVIPMMEKLGADYPYGPIHDAVVEFCRANGVPVLDLLPEFQGRNAEELWVHPVDRHPNEIAHRVIGEAIARDPEFRRLLDRRQQAPE